tara:strand:+ start:1136 stop:1714 length:579 start_codon:yes stop_codon:yes gene_type:complete
VSTVLKLKRTTTASLIPTTSDLEDGEVAINITDKKVFVRNGASIVTVANFSDSSVDLGAIVEHLLPDTTETYDLGSTSKRFRSLYLAGNTIDIGGSTISSDGTGTISISATGATLPLNSNVTVSSGVTKNIALAGADGSPVRSVPFFSKVGGLNSQNTELDFKADPELVVAAFTLSNGSQLGASTGNTLFFF